MKYGSFDVWIGSIKAALCREGQVSAGGCITGMTLDWRASFQSLYWVHTCVLLSLAAVRGRVGRDVFWVVAVFALCPLLILVLVVAVRGKATQCGGGGQLAPASNGLMKWLLTKILVFVNRTRFRCERTRHYLRPEVALAGESGLCRSCQSLSLILIVSSGASRHTKIQLMDKSIRALKIQHFISAWLLRKTSANTFHRSFPLADQSKDGFNSETDLIHSSSYNNSYSWSGVSCLPVDHVCSFKEFKCIFCDAWI